MLQPMPHTCLPHLTHLPVCLPAWACLSAHPAGGRKRRGGVAVGAGGERESSGFSVSSDAGACTLESWDMAAELQVCVCQGGGWGGVWPGPDTQAR